MSRYDWDRHAADWTPEQITEWKRASEAGEPVLRPYLEHEHGSCSHCDLLRQWQREVDADVEMLA